jgi:hypothetical protein
LGSGPDVVEPTNPAHFAVGDDRHPPRRLLGDAPADGVLLFGPQAGDRERAGGKGTERLDQLRGLHQAADVLDPNPAPSLSSAGHSQITGFSRQKTQNSIRRSADA